jgi:hypothetical protein
MNPIITHETRVDLIAYYLISLSKDPVSVTPARGGATPQSEANGFACQRRISALHPS